VPLALPSGRKGRVQCIDLLGVRYNKKKELAREETKKPFLGGKEKKKKDARERGGKVGSSRRKGRGPRLKRGEVSGGGIS